MTFDAAREGRDVTGFTSRQARFLVTVMLHSGVCMDRHYCAFARIAHGQKTTDFFASLVGGKFATAYACAHRRARIFHLHHRALYEAVGEPHSRVRKPTPIGAAIERLMILDAVLGCPSVSWLATRARQAGPLLRASAGRAFDQEDLPHLTFGNGVQTMRPVLPRQAADRHR